MGEGKAVEFAVRMHGDQCYGDLPYIVHLAAVRKVLRDFECQGPVCIAAWLHDVLEDTPATRDEVARLFGADVERLVWAVTGEGPDRRARIRSVVPKIRSVPGAIRLKLADRIANTEAARQSAPDRLQMYRAEAEWFAQSFRDLPDAFAAMWQRLDAAYG